MKILLLKMLKERCNFSLSLSLLYIFKNPHVSSIHNYRILHINLSTKNPFDDLTQIIDFSSSLFVVENLFLSQQAPAWQKQQYQFLCVDGFSLGCFGDFISSSLNLVFRQFTQMLSLELFKGVYSLKGEVVFYHRLL